VNAGGTAQEGGAPPKLRVGVETSAALFDAAGTGRYSREICRALAAEAPSDIEIVEIRAGGSSALRSWRRTSFVLWWELVYGPILLPRRIAAERLDLLHCTTPVPLPSGLAVPVVTTIHDTFLFAHPEWFTPVRRWRARRWWRSAARRSDHVLASSRATQEALARDLAVPQDRSSVVLLGTDLTQPTVTVAGERYLLSVGTIEPRKNLPTVLEALAELKARRGQVPPLYLAGAAGWGNVGVEAAVARLGLRDEVRLLGFVPEARLAELYSSALALVYVSLDEGFGFPALEAMASGCPVIAARAGSLPEVVGDAAMLVNPRDVAQIATAIGRLLTDPERAQAMRERGRVRARALSWRACARGTLDVYRRVATASPRSRR